MIILYSEEMHAEKAHRFQNRLSVNRGRQNSLKVVLNKYVARKAVVRIARCESVDVG